MNEDIKIAQYVIETEIKGLQALKSVFDNGFVQAVETVLKLSLIHI